MAISRFETYELSIELIRALAPEIGRIAQFDRDLADQIKRASSSVPLNLCEGSRRVGRDRLHLFRVAAGSAAEVRAALAVARAWGYVDGEAFARTDAYLDRVLAMLWRLTHARG